MSSRQKRRRRVEALWRKRLQETVALLSTDLFWSSAYMVDYGTSLRAFYKDDGGRFRGIALGIRAAKKQTAAQLVFRLRRKADELMIRRLLRARGTKS